jgi:hypothetical protein
VQIAAQDTGCVAVIAGDQAGIDYGAGANMNAAGVREERTAVDDVTASKQVDGVIVVGSAIGDGAGIVDCCGDTDAVVDGLGVCSPKSPAASMRPSHWIASSLRSSQ